MHAGSSSPSCTAPATERHAVCTAAMSLSGPWHALPAPVTGSFATVGSSGAAAVQCEHRRRAAAATPMVKGASDWRAIPASSQAQVDVRGPDESRSSGGRDRGQRGRRGPRVMCTTGWRSGRCRRFRAIQPLEGVTLGAPPYQPSQCPPAAPGCGTVVRWMLWTAPAAANPSGRGWVLLGSFRRALSGTAGSARSLIPMRALRLSESCCRMFAKLKALD